MAPGGRVIVTNLYQFTRTLDSCATSLPWVWQAMAMSIRRRFAAPISTAAIAALTVIAGAGAAQAQTQAPVAPNAGSSASLSSLESVDLVKQLSSRSAMPTLPPEAIEFADNYGIGIPDFLRPATEDLGALSEQLKTRTTSHLEEAGHHPDAEAQAIAQDWADQGARGEIEYIAGVGHGTNGTDQGTGSVLKLDAKQAQDRLVWLDRETNHNPDGTGFGVATATDGSYVYIAEYFLNN